MRPNNFRGAGEDMENNGNRQRSEDWTVRCRTRDGSGSFTLHMSTLEEVRAYCRSLARNSRVVAVERPDGSDGWEDAFVI